MTDTHDTPPEPAYLRWRKDNRIAGVLLTASLSILAAALAIIFGLQIARGTFVYGGLLSAAAIVSGLIMTHNKLALAVSKPLVLLIAGGCLFALSSKEISGTASSICCGLTGILALIFILISRGAHWTAFLHDVRSGEDSPSAAVRQLRNGK